VQIRVIRGELRILNSFFSFIPNSISVKKFKILPYLAQKFGKSKQKSLILWSHN
jgi:hypothetical protein